MSLFEVYFDESYGDDDGRILCVGGYVFSRVKCRAFDAEWRKMLKRYDLPYFRMSACAHRNAPFAALSKDRCISVEKEAIGLIKKYALSGFAVTVDRNDYDRIAVGNGLTADAYEMLIWLGVLMVRNWAEDSGRGDASIAYFFEAGHAAQRSANAMMDKIFRDPKLRATCMYGAHSFVDKTKARPSQAADLLAWQWYTDKKRAADPRFKGSRQDLLSLIEHAHQVMHVDASFLQETMDGLARMYPPPS